MSWRAVIFPRVLERRAARRDRPDLGAERVHPEHVRLLALDVLGAHVDDARQPEQRAGGRGRDAVLAGAGLGDDPGLAEPARQQRLAERVVDLVGAGVGEVLALQVEAEPVRQAGRAVGGDRPLEGLVREPVGAVERRRAAGEAREQLAQLRPEARVVAESRRTRPRAGGARPSASRGRSGRRTRDPRPSGRRRRRRAGPGRRASGGRRGSAGRGGRRGRA